MNLEELKEAIRKSVTANGLDRTLDALADLYHELGQQSEDGAVIFALSVANQVLKKAQ